MSDGDSGSPDGRIGADGPTDADAAGGGAAEEFDRPWDDDADGAAEEFDRPWDDAGGGVAGVADGVITGLGRVTAVSVRLAGSAPNA